MVFVDGCDIYTSVKKMKPLFDRDKRKARVTAFEGVTTIWPGRSSFKDWSRNITKLEAVRKVVAGR